MRGANDDKERADPHDISSDERTSDEEDNLNVPLDEAGKTVIKVCLSRRRAQLGLPAKGIARPDFSDDGSGNNHEQIQTHTHKLSLSLSTLSHTRNTRTLTHNTDTHKTQKHVPMCRYLHDLSSAFMNLLMEIISALMIHR
jgi:hypothetical protein